jgi:hypothetical protein
MSIAFVIPRFEVEEEGRGDLEVSRENFRLMTDIEGKFSKFPGICPSLSYNTLRSLGSDTLEPLKDERMKEFAMLPTKKTLGRNIVIQGREYMRGGVRRK